MDLISLHHLADVALSRGVSSVVPDVIERLPSTHLQRYPSMPHVNSYFEQNAQSPPPHNRIPAPTPHTRSLLALPNAQRQPQHEQLTANLIEQMSALFERFGFEVRLKNPRQQTQSSQWSSQSTFALSECEQRRYPLSTTQTPQDSGADRVCFSLPATGQRAGASPNMSPLVATPSTHTLPFQKSE